MIILDNKTEINAYGSPIDERLSEWMLHPENLTLIYAERDSNPLRWQYEVDLEGCRTCAGMLDWIMQVAAKRWENKNAVIGGLVTSLNEILRPQANLCSCGNDLGEMNVEAAVKHYVAQKL